jgi:hypothetical protein
MMVPIIKKSALGVNVGFKLFPLAPGSLYPVPGLKTSNLLGGLIPESGQHSGARIIE